MQLSWERLHLRQAVPFRTAKATRTDKDTVLVRIRNDGIEGWGEAAPTDTYRQDVESAERALAAMVSRLADANPFHLETLLDELVSAHPGQLAAVAAVDAALHDWIGKRLGIPVVHLLGLDETRVPTTSYTIGIDEPGAIADRVREAADYPIFKLKVGGSNDVDMLETIRRLAPDKAIRVDANAAWTADEAMAALAELSRFNLEFVEQPLAADDLDGFTRLRGETDLPIIADESCVVLDDVVRVAGRVDGINIKLGKCGGIRQAMKMIRVARALGLKVMLGCMIESALGIAAAAQLAPLADWIDLDGHLLITDGPFEGIGGAGGRLAIGGAPGLGVGRVR